MGNTINYHFRGNVPDDLSPLEWDPNYGFPEGARKKKVHRFTPEEIESMQLDLSEHGYCQHLWVQKEVCRRRNPIWFHRCNVLEHTHILCTREEEIDRMKDYERERRLMMRKQRILEKQKLRAAAETAAA